MHTITVMTTARVSDWSGTEPLDLLAAAHGTGLANGRFEYFATTDTIQNPLAEFQAIVSSSLLDRASEAMRLKVGAKHSRETTSRFQTLNSDGVALVALNKKGSIINHSNDLEQEWKRQRLENLGQTTKMPHRRLFWKWTGNSHAASACHDISTTTHEPILMKCCTTIEGSNIMEGLCQMMDLGLMDGDLPDFVRDTTSLVTIVQHNASTGTAFGGCI